MCDRARVADFEAQLPRIPILGAPNPDDPMPAPTAMPSHEGHDIVFCQLSSGSTGTPKFIQITHTGVIHHSFAVTEMTGLADTDRALNWLPLDHVGALLRVHVASVVMSREQYLLPTEPVIVDPLLWLRAVEIHAINYSWSRNFGFQAVVNACKTQGKSCAWKS